MKKPTLNKKLNQPRQKGNYYETIAADYLVRQGLTVLAQNFSCRQGEIDLICQQHRHNNEIILSELPTLVFVEVKYRQYQKYGGAIATISASKQRKIRHTAQYYMNQQGLNENYIPCRFDVIAIEGSIDNIQWITNAF